MEEQDTARFRGGSTGQGNFGDKTMGGPYGVYHQSMRHTPSQRLPMIYPPWIPIPSRPSPSIHTVPSHPPKLLLLPNPPPLKPKPCFPHNSWFQPRQRPPLLKAIPRNHFHEAVGGGQDQDHPLPDLPRTLHNQRRRTVPVSSPYQPTPRKRYYASAAFAHLLPTSGTLQTPFPQGSPALMTLPRFVNIPILIPIPLIPLRKVVVGKAKRGSHPPQTRKVEPTPRQLTETPPSRRRALSGGQILPRRIICSHPSQSPLPRRWNCRKTPPPAHARGGATQQSSSWDVSHSRKSSVTESRSSDRDSGQGRFIPFKLSPGGGSTSSRVPSSLDLQRLLSSPKVSHTKNKTRISIH